MKKNMQEYTYVYFFSLSKPNHTSIKLTVTINSNTMFYILENSTLFITFIHPMGSLQNYDISHNNEA